MRKDVWRVNGEGTNATEGRVVWAPVKSIWNTCMIVAALILGPATASIDSVAMFAILTYITLLFGHSVGMHRLLIHRSYECHPWLARTLTYVGVLVGMAGPFGILNNHRLKPVGLNYGLKVRIRVA